MLRREKGLPEITGKKCKCGRRLSLRGAFPTAARGGAGRLAPTGTPPRRDPRGFMPADRGVSGYRISRHPSHRQRRKLQDGLVIR